MKKKDNHIIGVMWLFSLFIYMVIILYMVCCHHTLVSSGSSSLKSTTPLLAPYSSAFVS